MKIKNSQLSKKFIFIISSVLLILITLSCFLLFTNNTSINNLTGTIVQVNSTKTYTVQFDSNKPTSASGNIGGTMSIETMPYNIPATLTTNTFTLTGWTFQNWNTQADGKGISYPDSASVTNLTIDDSITLYAQWIAKKTTVYLDQGGKFTATYDSEMPALTDVIDLPTSLNDSFKGYFDERNGGTQYYECDGTSAKKWNKTDESITLYAQWRKEEFMATFKWFDGLRWKSQTISQ